MKVVVICIPNQVEENVIKDASIAFSEVIGFDTAPMLLTENDVPNQRRKVKKTEFVKLIEKLEEDSGATSNSDKFKNYLKSSMLSTNNREALRILMSPSSSDITYLNNCHSGYIPKLAAQLYYVIDF